MGLVLGIDTSCYTTSLALMDEQGCLIAERRQILKVAEGSCGLRQSEAVWQHVKNLPVLLEQLLCEISARDLLSKLRAVAVSARPRPTAGSYMPVFEAGISFARALAAAWSVPLIYSSHQEGHLLAAWWSAGISWAKQPQRFLAVHLSGGTTELLLAEKNDEDSFISADKKEICSLYEIKKLGGTIDIPAGQLIDRIGVKLGLSFPAGAALEKLAQQCDQVRENENINLTDDIEQKITSTVRGYEINFSGAENQAERLLRSGAAPAVIARQTESCIAKALEKVLRRAADEYQLTEILLAGGVAANAYLRQRLIKRMQHRAVGAHLTFALPYYSTDNAAGIAMVGQQILK